MVLKWQAVGGHGVFPVKGTQRETGLGFQEGS